MAWFNDRQTLTKCDKCGKFISEAEAYYRKNNDYGVGAFCDEKCAEPAVQADASHPGELAATCKMLNGLFKQAGVPI